MNDQMYYHVRLTTRSNPDSSEFEFDLTLAQIEERFIEPYNLGEPIVVNGKTVPTDNLEQLRIGSTNLHSDRVNSDFLAEALAQRNVFPVDPRGRVNSQIIFERAVDETSRFVNRPPGSSRDLSTQNEETVSDAADPREVFVVQGRNTDANTALDLFLHAINLLPVEWPHATSATATGAPHIGHAVDVGLASAHAVIVLFTPDDEVKLSPRLWGDNEPEYETRKNWQARPNVIYEAGRAMERFPTRTVLVELGNLRPFSDVAGLHTIRLDDSPERRRDLADRLLTIGCKVNLDSRTLYSAGDFASAMAEESPPSLETPERDANKDIAARLSADAKDLLLAAANKEDRMIVVLRDAEGAAIRIGRKTFVDAPDAMAVAKWESVIKELLTHKLVNPYAGSGEAYVVTDQGFLVAFSLGKTIE